VTGINMTRDLSAIWLAGRRLASAAELVRPTAVG
jgi:hypothetical protein